MGKKTSVFFEENRNENEFYLVAQGEMPFLWLEEYAGKIRLCDFEGIILEDASEHDVEQLVVDWLNRIYADPGTVKDVTFFTPVHKNGRFEIK